MPTRQVRSSLPVPTAASWCGCAMIPTSPLTVSMAITQGPMPDGRREREAERLERGLHAVETADRLEAERDEHERERDDQEALEQIGPGRRNQAADEAVEP